MTETQRYSVATICAVDPSNAIKRLESHDAIDFAHRVLPLVRNAVPGYLPANVLAMVQHG